jgi:hypothetical protein
LNNTKVNDKPMLGIDYEGIDRLIEWVIFSYSVSPYYL